MAASLRAEFTETEILDIVTIKLNSFDKVKVSDDMKKVYIYEACERIGNYLLRDRVPEELLYTTSDIVVDLILANYKLLQDMEGKAEAITKIKKITVGRTTIENGDTDSSSSSSTTKFNPYKNFQLIVSNYYEELNPYRKLW